MEVGNLVVRNSDPDSLYGDIDIQLTSEEKVEIGIITFIEDQKGFSPLHTFGDRPKPINLVVLWSHTGISWEDPDDLEAWK